MLYRWTVHQHIFKLLSENNTFKLHVAKNENSVFRLVLRIETIRDHLGVQQSTLCYAVYSNSQNGHKQCSSLLHGWSETKARPEAGHFHHQEAVELLHEWLVYRCIFGQLATEQVLSRKSVCSHHPLSMLIYLLPNASKTSRPFNSNTVGTGHSMIRVGNTYVDLIVMQRSCSSLRVSVKRVSPARAEAMMPAFDTSESVKVDFPWSTCAITDMLRMLDFLSMMARIWSMVKFT